MSTASEKIRPSDALPILLYVAVHYIDRKLPDIAIYPIYLVPILWATSKWGLRAGMPLAVLSGAMSTPMQPLLEWGKNIASLDIIITRSTILILLAIFYSNYANQVKSNRRRIDRLKTIVPQCPDCGAIFCHDGQWRSLAELTSDPECIGVTPKHGCHVSKQPNKQ